MARAPDGTPRVGRMSLKVDITKAQGDLTLKARFEAKNGLTVVFGPSGSGKTTLVRAIAGLEKPDAGHIALGQEVLFDAGRRDVPPHARQIGYVFQEPRLFPHMSVEKNLRFAERFVRGASDEDMARRIIEMLGISHLLERRPAKLSGGEQGRVALGRALLARPRLLLADEPLAALDPARKAELLPYFERLRDAEELPILYVTHSVSELGRLASEVLTIDAGTAIGTMSSEAALADPAIMPGGVRGVGALVHAKLAAQHEDGLSELDAGGARLFLPRIKQEIGAALRLRIAAQDVILAREEPRGLSALNILEGTVKRLRIGAGPGAIVSLETPAGEIQARITRRSARALELAEGVQAFAIVKTVSVAREDIGPDG